MFIDRMTVRGLLNLLTSASAVQPQPHHLQWADADLEEIQTHVKTCAECAAFLGTTVFSSPALKASEPRPISTVVNMQEWLARKSLDVLNK